MPVAFRSKNSLSTGNGTSATFSEPAGAAENDVFFMYVVIDTGMGFITEPSGWTMLSAETHSSFEITRLYWIRRGASAPSLGFSWDNNVYRDGCMIAYSGVKTTGNPYNKSADSGSSTANPSNPDPPSVTTTVADCMVVAFGMGWYGWAAGGATAPSGYTLRHGAQYDDTGIADKLLSGTATENPGTFTNQVAGTNDRSATTVALEPAGSTRAPSLSLLGVG